MPVGTGGSAIAPFADEALRLLREKWANPTMLAEEVFAILQQKIPKDSGALTINIGQGSLPGVTIAQAGSGPFLQFKNEFGQVVGQIDKNGFSPPPSTNIPRRVRPIISWSNPEDITAGTALDGTQLNATASDPNSGQDVPGQFDYSPGSGTVLTAGNNQTLSVVFSPTNRDTYSRANKSVQINVLPGGFALVNNVRADGGIFDTSISHNLSVVAGNLILVRVELQETNSAGSMTFTVTDSDGHTYTQEGGYVRETTISGTADIAIACFWVNATITHTISITITPSAPANYGFEAFQYSGNHASPFRAVSTNSEHQPPGPSHVYTTTAVGASAHDLIVGLFMCGNSMSPADSPFTSINSANMHDLDASGSLAATHTGTAAGDDSSTYVAIGIAFRPA